MKRQKWVQKINLRYFKKEIPGSKKDYTNKIKQNKIDHHDKNYH